MNVVMPLIIVLIIAVGVLSMVQGKKTESLSKRERQARKMQQYRKLYSFLANNFITQNGLQRIHSKLAQLSVYRKEELYFLSSKLFLMSWGATLGLCIVGFILFHDALCIILCILFGLLLNNTLIEKQLDKLHKEVLLALSSALGSIQQEYLRLGNVVEAISEADVSDILKRPFDDIYNILTASNSEERIQEFYEATPFRPLQTLVGICAKINNEGDTLDAYGQSNFTQALITLSTDVDSEVRKIITQKSKFGIIEYLPFVPLVGIPLIEMYFQSIMPGTALIYGGMLGYLFRTAIITVCLISYGVISRINSTVPVKEDDRSDWAMRLLENKHWKRFIENWQPKGKKLQKWGFVLKNSMSRQTLSQVYTKKIIFGAVAIVFATATALTTVQLGRQFVLTSTQQLSLTSSNEMDAYSQTAIANMDAEYIAQRQLLQPEHTLEYDISQLVLSVQKLLGLVPQDSLVGGGSKYPDLPEDTVKGMIKGVMPGLTDLQIIDQQKRLNDKFETLQTSYFHWYFVWLIFLVGVIGYNVPELQLKLRRILAWTEAEDDFLQLQALVSVLMTTNMDTLDVLYELCQHSRIHKDMLLYCYHSFPSNPELELSRLEAKTPISDFKRLIGNFKLTINDLSLGEACSRLKIEREQIMSIRETKTMEMIDRKRGLCGPLSMLPLGAMVIGELIVPLGYLGIREFSSALSMMNS